MRIYSSNIHHCHSLRRCFIFSISRQNHRTDTSFPLLYAIMAPADTPGRKKREAQYFEVGVQGRFVAVKTGRTRMKLSRKLTCTIDVQVSNSKIVAFATNSVSSHKKAYSHHPPNKHLNPCAMLATHVKAMARQMAQKTWMLEGVSWRVAHQIRWHH